MSDVALSALDPRQQKLIDHARLALARGYLDYTVEACAQVLQAAPACAPVRRLQRAAQLRQFKTRTSAVAKSWRRLTAAPRLLVSPKVPAKALASAERLLASDPTNVAALERLAEAADRLQWGDTVILAREAIRELAPADHDNLLALGEAWLAAGKPPEALHVADELIKLRPMDARAQNFMRQAAISQTTARGKWEDSGTFREKLKDEAQTISLEQSAKAETSQQMARRLIEAAIARAAQEPDNLNHYRAVIDGYRKTGELAKALDWLRKARERPGASIDPSVERQETDLTAELLRQKLQAAEAAAQAAPDNAAAKTQVFLARAELEEFRIREARNYVERYPNDLVARQTLGAIYLESGQLDAAIAQFQSAQKNPQVRVAALVGLGRAFKGKRLFDLAIAQLTTAKSEVSAMNDAKKEILYLLGECHEARGERDCAMTAFKAIYSEDIGYRDVAQRVDAFYAQPDHRSLTS